MHNKNSLRIPAQYGLPGLKFNGNWWETWKIKVIYFFFSLKQKCKTCFLYDIDRETVTCNKGVLFCLFKASKRWAWSARHEHNAFFGYVYLSFRRSYTGRFAMTVFFAQHSVAMLEQCCKYSKQCRNNVEMMCCVKNRRCKSSRVTSHLIIWYLILLRFASTLRLQGRIQDFF